MKHYTLFRKLIVLILVSLFFAGCKNNVNTMLDDYNEHYEPATNLNLLKSPGDEGFSSENMLDDYYYVSSEGSITIGAPYRCKSYEWAFYKTINSKKRIGDNGESTKLTAYEDITDKLYFYNGSGKNKREFCFYVPQSQIETDMYLQAGTYVLTLKIIGNDNNTYSDSSTVVIYEQSYGFLQGGQNEES